MKLKQLFEERCRECSEYLTPDDFQSNPGVRQGYCQQCGLRADKKRKRVEAEEENQKEREDSSKANQFFVSKQMPDRGYDKDRGTPGWLMGEPSPGRSF